jgi:hypothetical protein
MKHNKVQADFISITSAQGPGGSHIHNKWLGTRTLCQPLWSLTFSLTRIFSPLLPRGPALISMNDCLRLRTRPPYVMPLADLSV